MVQVAIGKAQGALVKYAVKQGGLNASMLTGSKLIGLLAQITPLAGNCYRHRSIKTAYGMENGLMD